MFNFYAEGVTIGQPRDKFVRWPWIYLHGEADDISSSNYYINSDIVYVLKSENPLYEVHGTGVYPCNVYLRDEDAPYEAILYWTRGINVHMGLIVLVHDLQGHKSVMENWLNGNFPKPSAPIEP